MNYEKLKLLCKRATQGPFSIERRDSDDGSIDYIVYGIKGDFAHCSEEVDDNAKANAEFIEAFPPEVVLEMLKQRRNIEKKAKALMENLYGGEPDAYFWSNFYSLMEELGLELK